MKQLTHHLITLIRNHLETNVPDEKFHIGAWACGTTACAMGHACSIPELRARGLALLNVDGDIKLLCVTAFGNSARYYAGDAVRVALDMEWEDALRLPNSDGKNNPEHVINFLFTPDSYQNGGHTKKKEVIDRLDEFLSLNPPS